MNAACESCQTQYVNTISFDQHRWCQTANNIFYLILVLNWFRFSFSPVNNGNEINELPKQLTSILNLVQIILCFHNYFNSFFLQKKEYCHFKRCRSDVRWYANQVQQQQKQWNTFGKRQSKNACPLLTLTLYISVMVVWS